MKQWFPLTDYNFYAYITAGMLFIAVMDYTFAGSVLSQRPQWTVVQVVFWAASAYVIGQLLAWPAAAILEHGIARTFLHAPVAVLLGLREQRLRERTFAKLFAKREYTPFPEQVREHIFQKAADTLKVHRSELNDPETVFEVAYSVVNSVPGAATRVDQFRNMYGFSRNISFVALTAVLVLSVQLYLTPTKLTAGLLALALIMSIGMFGRFLKFYASFSREILRTYCFITFKDDKEQKQ
jgi:hypothetical protein